MTQITWFRSCAVLLSAAIAVFAVGCGAGAPPKSTMPDEAGHITKAYGYLSTYMNEHKNKTPKSVDFVAVLPRYDVDDYLI